MGTSQSSHDVEASTLQRFADDGDLQGMRKLLRGSSDRQRIINARSKDGETALLIACKSLKADIGTLKRDKIVQDLVNFGADVNVKDTKRGWTALHHACSVGAIDTVQILLQRGCDPYVRDSQGLVAQQVIASLVQGYEPLRALDAESDEDNVSEDDSEVDDYNESEDNYGEQNGGKKSGLLQLEQQQQHHHHRHHGATTRAPESQIRLPKALIQEAWPLFLAKGNYKKWMEQIHLQLITAEIKQNGKLKVILHIPNTATLKKGLENFDFLQVVYVKEKPWNLSPVFGCFKRLTIADDTLLDQQYGTISMSMQFDVKDFPPGYSYRLIYVCGEMSSTPESIRAASDIFHVEYDYRVLYAKQSFFIPAAGNESDDDDEEEEEEEDEVTEEEDGGYESDEELITEDEEQEEEEEGDGYESDDEFYEPDVQFVYGAPWHLDPLPNKIINQMRDDLLKEKALALSQDRSIWQSRWTQLVNPPPSEFTFMMDAVKEQARIALALDPNLEQARLELVPSKISELTFWRAYFWHMEQIKLQVVDILSTPESLKEQHELIRQNQDNEENENDEEKIVIVPISYSPDAQVAILREHVRRKLKTIRYETAETILDDDVEDEQQGQEELDTADDADISSSCSVPVENASLTAQQQDRKVRFDLESNVDYPLNNNE